MQYVAGIVVGTSGCKTAIVNREGVVVASRSQEYYARMNQGMVEMDPLEWWKAAARTLQESCAAAGITPQEVVAVGCSGQMQGCTFIGTNGKPSRDSMLWYDITPKEESQSLNAQHGELFKKHACMASAPSLTGSKIKWVMNHEPEVWAKTSKFLFAANFIAYQLTGVLAVDRSNLGLSGLNDVRRNDWSPELLEATGVTPDKVPTALNCLDIVGKVTLAAAAFTGLRLGTPVIAGCGDATGECFSVNISGRPEVKLRLGSAAAVNAVIPMDWLGVKAESATPYLGEGQVAVGNFTKGCALSVKWLRDVFFSELAKEDASYDQIDREASDSPLGGGGIIYHPFLNGEHAPYYDPDLRGKFSGIGIASRRGDFARAVYEGTAFSIRDMIANDSALSLMEKVVICGGGAKSALWLAILADVLGKPGIVPKSADAAFGVALMAGQAIGLLDGGVAADQSRAAGFTVNFNPHNHEKYQAIFERYLSLVRM
jgi:xylulokinase